MLIYIYILYSRRLSSTTEEYWKSSSIRARSISASISVSVYQRGGELYHTYNLIGTTMSQDVVSVSFDNISEAGQRISYSYGHERGNGQKAFILFCETENTCHRQIKNDAKARGVSIKDLILKRMPELLQLCPELASTDRGTFNNYLTEEIKNYVPRGVPSDQSVASEAQTIIHNSARQYYHPGSTTGNTLPTSPLPNPVNNNHLSGSTTGNTLPTSPFPYQMNNNHPSHSSGMGQPNNLNNTPTHYPTQDTRQYAQQQQVASDNISIGTDAMSAFTTRTNDNMSVDNLSFMFRDSNIGSNIGTPNANNNNNTYHNQSNLNHTGINNSHLNNQFHANNLPQSHSTNSQQMNGSQNAVFSPVTSNSNTVAPSYNNGNVGSFGPPMPGVGSNYEGGLPAAGISNSGNQGQLNMATAAPPYSNSDNVGQPLTNNIPSVNGVNAHGKLARSDASDANTSNKQRRRWSNVAPLQNLSSETPITDELLAQFGHMGFEALLRSMEVFQAKSAEDMMKLSPFSEGGSIEDAIGQFTMAFLSMALNLVLSNPDQMSAQKLASNTSESVLKAVPSAENKAATLSKQLELAEGLWRQNKKSLDDADAADEQRTEEYIMSVRKKRQQRRDAYENKKSSTNQQLEAKRNALAEVQQHIAETRERGTLLKSMSDCTSRDKGDLLFRAIAAAVIQKFSIDNMALIPYDIVEEHIRQAKNKEDDLVGAEIGGASDDVTALTDPTLATNTFQEVTSISQALVLCKKINYTSESTLQTYNVQEMKDLRDAARLMAELLDNAIVKKTPCNDEVPDDDARKAAAQAKSEMKDHDKPAEHKVDSDVNTVPESRPVFRVNLKSNVGKNGRGKNRKFPPPPPRPRQFSPPPPRAATMGASTDDKSIKSTAPSLPSLPDSLMSGSTALPNMSMSGEVRSTEDDEEEQR